MLCKLSINMGIAMTRHTGLPILLASAVWLLLAAAPAPDTTVVPPNPRLAPKTLDDAPLRCDDFLARMHLKPRGVRFVSCSYLPGRQGKPFRAVYRVPGRFAALAERTFVRAVGMPSLRRSCCQWDAPPHWFHGRDGREYGITMVSDETGARSRAAWPGVPVFEIVIEMYTEDI